MASNTTTVCTQVAQFNSNVVVYNQRGVKGTCAAGKVTTIDLKMLDDVYLTGGVLLAKNAAFGDFCDMQVVDVDNIMGYGAGAVLRQFVTNYFMDDSSVNQGAFDLPYPAKIITGLYMRLVYHSTGMTAPQAAVNFALHTILT